MNSGFLVNRATGQPEMKNQEAVGNFLSGCTHLNSGPPDKRGEWLSLFLLVSVPLGPVEPT